MQFKLLNKVIFTLVILIGVRDLDAQFLNFHHYSTDQGLPQSTVWAIVQDSSGYIWFGTEAGIAKFDGVNFTNYNLSNGLVGNNVGVLYIDRTGSIWVGTDDGISILFEDEIINYTTENGLSDDFIDGIVEGNDGSMWVVTRYGGVCRLKDAKIECFSPDNDFPSRQLSNVYKDSKGNIWFTSIDKGVIEYDGSNFINLTADDGLLSNRVNTIFEDKDGLYWIGTDKGVSIFNGKTFLSYSIKQGFPEKEVDEIIQDKNGDIWIGYSNYGLYRFDGKNIFKHEGLGSKEIRSIYVDKRGDLWVGTFLSGVNRLPIDWFEVYPNDEKIAFSNVYSIAQDTNNRMYFAHWTKGISFLDNGKFTNIHAPSRLFLGNEVTSIIFDDKQNMWVGSMMGVVKSGQNGIKQFNSASGLKYPEVLRIFQDSKSNVWLGSREGITKIDPVSNSIIGHYSKDIGLNEGTLVNDIFEDDKSNIWFATHYSGLIVYDGTNFSKIDTSNGLPHNNIISITQDRKGFYWISTDGKGVCRYDGNKFINITEKDGLSSDICYFVLENGDELYIGTVNGLSILKNNINEDSKNYEFRYLSKKDGLPENELNQGAYYKTSDGYLWFGTNGGLIKIDPTKNVIDEQLPVILTSIIVSDGSEEDKFSSSIKEELRSEQNNVTINFSSIVFNKPQDVFYEVKLEGIEDHWSITKNNSITYRALPAGSYKFWATAKNSESSISEPVLLATFTISTPFYKTWWFITSLIIFTSLMVYLVYYIKTQQVKKKNEALEQMVRERTKELEKEKNKSEELLLNILPASLVNELKKFGNVRPRRFSSVSIMFTDFKAFTYTTSVLPPEELVHELNDIFKGFDSLIGKYGLEKLKTIGDSYMAACGIPKEIEDHAVRIVYAALDFQKLISERNKTSPIKWEMRLGIHSGSVVAGVVGTKKFTYDIWGDTVNIASRMESSSEPGEINISGYTYMLVRDHFVCEYRGKVETKGKGSIDMYFVKGIKQTANTQKKTTFKSFTSLKHIN